MQSNEEFSNKHKPSFKGFTDKLGQKAKFCELDKPNLMNEQRSRTIRQFVAFWNQGIF